LQIFGNASECQLSGANRIASDEGLADAINQNASRTRIAFLLEFTRPTADAWKRDPWTLNIAFRSWIAPGRPRGVFISYPRHGSGSSRRPSRVSATGSKCSRYSWIRRAVKGCSRSVTREDSPQTRSSENLGFNGHSSAPLWPPICPEPFEIEGRDEGF